MRRIAALLLPIVGIFSTITLRAEPAGPGQLLHAQDVVFHGRWVSTDERPESFTELVISETEGRDQLWAWARCTPTPCAWAPVPITFFGEGVNSRLPKYGAAVLTSDLARRLFLLERTEAGLELQFYTAFLDNSGRSNYRTTQRFVRVRADAAGNPESPQ